MKVAGERVRSSASTVESAGGAASASRVSGAAESACAATARSQLAGVLTDVGADLASRVRALGEACQQWASDVRGATQTYDEFDAHAAASVRRTSGETS